VAAARAELDSKQVIASALQVCVCSQRRTAQWNKKNPSTPNPTNTYSELEIHIITVVFQITDSSVSLGMSWARRGVSTSPAPGVA